MENIILFDDDHRDALLPLTFTRPVAEIRIGILTIKEKWEKWLGGRGSYMTKDYLSEKYPMLVGEENLIINGAVLPTPELVREINNLELDQALLYKGELIAVRLSDSDLDGLEGADEEMEFVGREISGYELKIIRNTWDIFQMNGEALISDFEMLTRGKTSQPLSFSNQIIGKGSIFLEEGVKMEGCILNVTSGPIYLGKNAEVMEGSVIRGPFALGENAVIKMSTKIYGPTTIGPGCKVGGEVNNSVLFSNSNKAHDGFLGNSVIGEWCNLGADTNNSNLKNNYSDVKLWSFVEEKFVSTGQQFCGLIMGDHSKCGINTMFNTGTVVGVCANIFGAGYPRNYIPSFTWGGTGTNTTYKLQDAFETTERVWERRGILLDEVNKSILKRIFEDSAPHRSWEKS
jgi:UDP-N-acetylglucosamine diphosphorylase/glucosamine-1-phosphate N-acetyltransferase